MNEKKISTLITTKNIVINFDSQTFIINKSSKSKKYEALKAAIKAKDNEAIIDIIIPKEKVIKYANDFFVCDDKGILWMKDDESVPVPVLISETLMLFVEEELPLDPLINFWKKLRDNPLESAREDLYRFLEHNNHPITPDGNFIAYKRVNEVDGELVDNYTKKISNNPGAVVKMDRSKVDSNSNNTCSHGLHVAAWDYAQIYAGNVLIEMLVNPKDVCAVPHDYNNQKMRVCQYEVLNRVNDPRKETLAEDVVDEKGTNDAGSDNFISLVGLTAKKIVALVKEKCGFEITSSLKNKKPIVNKAEKLLKEKGFDVERD